MICMNPTLGLLAACNRQLKVAATVSHLIDLERYWRAIEGQRVILRKGEMMCPDFTIRKE